MGSSSYVTKLKDIIYSIIDSPMIGTIHAVNSTILLAIGHFAAQLAILSTPTMAKLEVVFTRSLGQIVMLVPFILLFQSKVLYSRDKWLIMFLLSVSGYACYLGLYFILDLIPLSIALAISGTCPFFASIFSYFILKEKMRIVDFLCGVASLLGVLLIARPAALFGKYGKKTEDFYKDMPQANYEILYLTGCGVALLFGMARAAYLVFARLWARDATDGKPNQIVTVFYPSILGTFVTPFIMIFSTEGLVVPKETYGICSLIAVGILTSLGLMCLTMAIKTQNATVVGVIRNLEIVWAFVLQYFVLGLVPSRWNMGGTAIIVTATIVASIQDKICKPKEEAT